MRALQHVDAVDLHEAEIVDRLEQARPPQRPAAAAEAAERDEVMAGLEVGNVVMALSYAMFPLCTPENGSAHVSRKREPVSG